MLHRIAGPIGHAKISVRRIDVHNGTDHILLRWPVFRHKAETVTKTDLPHRAPLLSSLLSAQINAWAVSRCERTITGSLLINAKDKWRLISPRKSCTTRFLVMLPPHFAAAPRCDGLEFVLQILWNRRRAVFRFLGIVAGFGKCLCRAVEIQIDQPNHTLFVLWEFQNAS